MIEINGLCKSFDGYQALNNMNIKVQSGSIYGLIGTNGAGKTTVIRHMAGIIKADAGEVLFDGENVWDNEGVKQRIGLIPDELYFPNNSAPDDMRRFYSSVYRNWDDSKYRHIMDLFKLDPHKKVGTFSKGMKKQVAFALAMAKNPDYLILDEPIDGLDPIVRKIVWRLIVDDVAEKEMSVLVSSHNLKEMEGICDYIGIVDHGEMKLERELDLLKGRIHKVQVSFGKDGLPPEINDNLNIIHRDTRGSVELLIIANSMQTIEETIGSRNPVLFDILPLSLEEIFIYELGGESDEISKLIL